jgi:hypothetical protein
MRQPRIEGRVTAEDMARVRAFSSAWRAFHGGTDADAFRALLRLGLDSAGRPHVHDARLADIEDRLQRIEVALDALGRAVSGTPALVTWLLANVPAPAPDAPSADALADALETLLECDWDERCRLHGVPRPRPTRETPAAPLGTAAPVPDSPAGSRLRATTVRLSPRDFDRAAAHAVRLGLGRQAALVDLVQRGLDSAEATAARDTLARLLDRARRIERQLDLIGPLATSPASVAIHLFRHIAGRNDEWERVLLHEVRTVAEATWRGLHQGPPQPVPGRLALDPIDDTEGDGWPT